MSVFDFLGSIIKPVSNLIDNIHTSDEERLKLRNEFAKMQNEIQSQVLGYETKLMTAQSSIINAEATGSSWMQRNWRPVTMLTMLILVVLEALGVTPKPLPEWFGTLFQIGLGGYVVGRSAEKVAPAIVKGLKR